jgi:hypothetical protein
MWTVNGDTATSSAVVTVFTRDELQQLPPNVAITGFELDKTDDATTGPGTGTLEIYLANTAATTVIVDTLANHKSTATLAYSSTAQRIPATRGWWSPGAFNGSPFTYTGGNLKVIVVWNGTALPQATRSYNRAKVSFGGYPGGNKTLGRVSNTPVQDSDSIAAGSIRPNVRLTFNRAATGYLVVSVGELTITPGATYQNPNAFAAGITTPNVFLIKNVGDTALDLSTGIVFNAQTNVTNATITAPPASLASGASATIAYSHTPAASGAAQYTVTIGTVSFTVQGNASSQRVHTTVIVVDSDGRTHPPGYSGASQDSIVGASEPFSLRLINDGTADVTSATVTINTCTNLTLTCNAATGFPWAPSTEHDIACTSTVPAAGSSQQCIIYVQTNGSGGGQVYFQRNGVTATAAPPVGEPEILVFYQADGVNNLTPVADGATIDRPPVRTEPLLVTIKNDGTAPLVVNRIDTDCNGKCALDLDGTSFPLTIPESESRLVTLTFDSQEVADWDAVAHIISNDLDPGEDSFDVTFRYRAGPEIEAEFAPVPPLTAGIGNVLPVTIRNPGNAELTLGDIVFVESVDCPATVSIVPLSVPAGGMEMFDAAVTPRAGISECHVDLVIASNDAETPQLHVTATLPVSDIPAPPDGGCFSASRGGTRTGGYVLAALGMIAMRVRRRARGR